MHETWVIGSGNLTPRGLRDSFEVFSVLEGKSSALVRVRRPFEKFLADHADDIREIDAAALARAAKNKPTRPVRDIEPPIDHPVQRLKQSPSRMVGMLDRVLIAELPRGGARWQQANFDGETVQSFFGIQPTPRARRQELFFNEVDRSGNAVSEEVRRFTYTRSKNWRVQLAARNGETYPDRGRPIAAFREVKPRHFVYQLLLPGEQGYKSLKSILDKHEDGEIRRYLTTVKELRSALPTSALLASG